ncbi:MAG: hypothetical protein JWQ37_682 [Blastococcus sp.]|nr:hypothetical protein [Blastococcus sp.]
MAGEDEVRELRALLEQEDLVPAVALSVVDRFGGDVRDALITEVARQFAPPPPGRLLARLLPLVSDASLPVLTRAYLSNLRSPDPQARLASLQGLIGLDYPHAADVSLAALRDDEDTVVGAAVQNLLPLGQQDELVRDLLGGLEASHRDDPGFHLTKSLLSAHGIQLRETP